VLTSSIFLLPNGTFFVELFVVVVIIAMRFGSQCGMIRRRRLSIRRFGGPDAILGVRRVVGMGRVLASVFVFRSPFVDVQLGSVRAD